MHPRETGTGDRTKLTRLRFTTQPSKRSLSSAAYFLPFIPVPFILILILADNAGTVISGGPVSGGQVNSLAP